MTGHNLHIQRQIKKPVKSLMLHGGVFVASNSRRHCQRGYSRKNLQLIAEPNYVLGSLRWKSEDRARETNGFGIDFSRVE